MTSKNRVLKDTAARSRARGVRKGRSSQLVDGGVSDAGTGLEHGNSNAPLEGALPTSDDMRQRLTDHLGALRFVNGTLAVCAQALRQQNADMDADIALVIQRTAGDKLDATIEQIEELVFGLELPEVAQPRRAG